MPYSMPHEVLWQFLATVNLVLGGWYIVWRWGWSLNYDALWLALPLAMAETAAYFGLVLSTINLWATRDYQPQPSPELITDCVRTTDRIPARPICIDVYFPTYNEAPELVRLSIQDAKRITYPHPVDIQIYVLDDGKREAMRRVAEEEEVN
jgi:cellulose synthase (UDP-forming)